MTRIRSQSERKTGEGRRSRALSISPLGVARALALAGVLLSQGCFTNSRLADQASKVSGSSRTSGTSNDGSSSSSSSSLAGALVYKISTVNIAAPAQAQGQAGMVATILFDASKSSGPITTSCNVVTNQAQTSKPCGCIFSWSEINTTGGTTVPIPRTVQTTVTNVQPNVVVCNAPSVYTAEIPDGTVIKITVIPSGTNTEQFTVPQHNFTKQGTVVTGSFQDAEGRAFDNILRYSCYEQFKRGMKISTFRFPTSNPRTGETAHFLMASKFCVSKAAGGGAGAGCEGTNVVDNSAQAYYYNLYIRNTDKGSINVENTRYKCPKVKETLSSIGTVGSSNDFWPLDSNFAVALSKTPEFPIGIEAFSKVGIGGDPSSQSSSCQAATGGGGGGGGAGAGTDALLRSCLGFAAKPNPDGTCPFFRDANGLIRFTFRLRRFIALYPQVFDTNGEMVNQPQSSDVVYVLDRPVSANAADPLRPFTMRGPKPCPFAYFDHKGVLGDPNDVNYPGGMPKYAATNNVSWTGTNVDGIELPNKDEAGACSAAMPLLSDRKKFWTFGTVNVNNPVMKRVFIRPVQAWAPHYEEDTDFQACAPQASPFKDPPLHFAKDPSTGNVAWCAEAYPTQNPFVGDLDKRSGDGTGPYPGKVIPFTSHVVKNSASAECKGTIPNMSEITASYPSQAGTTVGQCTTPGTDLKVAWHPHTLLMDQVPKISSCLAGGDDNGGGPNCFYCAHQTCDRTVQNAGLAWTKFPMLARALQVEQAISADSTYSCMVTFDNGLGKTGKLTPAQGCCGNNVKLWTGTSGGTANILNTSAHLEPNATTPCLVPAYQ